MHVETIKLDDSMQAATWGDSVYRILATLTKPTLKGAARFTFA
jgi:hypothetical protein